MLFDLEGEVRGQMCHILHFYKVIFYVYNAHRTCKGLIRNAWMFFIFLFVKRRSSLNFMVRNVKEL